MNSATYLVVKQARNGTMIASDQLFDRAVVNQAFRFLPPLSLIYLLNPKCACSTILFSLWSQAEKIAGRDLELAVGGEHDWANSPFTQNIFEDQLDERILEGA